MTDAARGIRPAEGFRLDDLAREIPGASFAAGSAAVRVFGVHHDSRRVEAGDLFVVRKGARADGARFVTDAEARGAAAILAEEGAAIETQLPILRVREARTGLAYASAAVYGHPSFGVDVIGITGTNGKTTTAHLLRAAIDDHEGEAKCGLIGTVGHRLGSFAIEAAHTTPEADELARLLAVMKARGAKFAAMEVSSIALAAGRVDAIRFRVAAFTNLTQDHLDYHGSMEAYGEAKRELFARHAPGSAVVQVDDPLGKRLAVESTRPTVRVSLNPTSDADVKPRRASFHANGIDALVMTPKGDVELRSGLVGKHNLENLLVALGISIALDLPVQAAANAIGREAGVPGRLERVSGPEDDVVVLVDYAHTPDALIRVLAAVRDVSQARLGCVFGCGGDRDPTKRPLMGAAAAEGADFAVVTSDNPRSEDPRAIAGAIEKGMGAMNAAPWPAPRTGLTNGYVVELDREEAIQKTIAAAAPGEVIVIAGKGHETYQVIGNESRFFDDRLVARAALATRRGR